MKNGKTVIKKSLKLTEKFQKERFLPKNFYITLPSEAQWEKTVKGGKKFFKIPIYASINNLRKCYKSIISNKKEINWIKNKNTNRIYPWGNTHNENLANCKHSKISATSTVGCFPKGASPYGCEELCGNVSEWTLSIYKDYPYESNDGREDLETIERNTTIAIRGGHFNDTSIQYCTSRQGYEPDSEGTDLGFRVLVSMVNRNN